MYNTRTSTYQKYERATLDLHRLLQHRKKINLSKWCKRRGLNTNYPTALKRLGILKVNGAARGATYEWATEWPTERMVHEVCELMRRMVDDYHAKTAKYTPRKKQPKEEVYKIPVLFGLFHIPVKRKIQTA